MTVVALAIERRNSNANAGNKLSMSGLYGAAPFCGRIRKIGVRILRHQL